MKRLLVGTTALLALALPQAAFSKNVDAGSAGYAAAPASSQAQPQQATPNFHANGAGTVASCGNGCANVSGTYTSNQFAGTFSGGLTQSAAGDGCWGVQGTINLFTDSSSAILGVRGFFCGAHFSGTYTVSDGTGAYQEDGAGWGSLRLTATPAGTVQMSVDGTFYGNQARQTGVDYGSPQ